MSKRKRFFTLIDVRNKEFYRDTSALAWNFLFPFIVIVGFGFAFSGKSQDIFKVAVIGEQKALSDEFSKTQYVQFVSVDDREQAIAKLRRHQYDMVFSSDGNYWINSTAPKGYLLERVLWGSGDNRSRFHRQIVEGREIRYVDWLISGLLAMNMMFSALFGVGYTIVRYRKNGVLKRLKATPLRAVEFLSAQVFSRLIVIQLTSVLVYMGSHALIHFQMLGSYWNLFLVMSLGAMCLIALGLLLAARVSSEELEGGLLNLITWPMMFLSGVWFSLEGAHPVVKKFAQIFPLTHVIDAARAIMTEGANISQVSGNVTALLVMTIVFLLTGALLFKWE